MQFNRCIKPANDPERQCLGALAGCLRGEHPANADWTAIIYLANRTLLTPALFEALRPRLPARKSHGRRPRLFGIYSRSQSGEKHASASQLVEAVGAFNEVGIEPTLLKGAVRLFCDPDERLGSRMTKDIDLSVEEEEGCVGRERLIGIGYKDVVETRGMERPGDVGVLEMRQRPSARSAAYLSREHEKPPMLVARMGVRANIPSPTSRALHWIVHDLIKEGDYWQGCIDLRHLYDLAELARTEKGVDWAYLRGIMPDQLGRNVLDTQLLTLNSLFGTSIPPDVRRRTLVRFQHWRRMFTARHPLAGAPLRLAGKLAWGRRQMGSVESIIARGPAEFAPKVLRTLIGNRGKDEVSKVLPKLIMALVVEALDRRVLDSPVHPLDLTVRPWMARLGQTMCDVEIGAGRLEGVAAEEHLLGAHGLDLRRRPGVAGRLGKVGAVVGEHGVDLVGDGGSKGSEEIAGNPASGLLAAVRRRRTWRSGRLLRAGRAFPGRSAPRRCRCGRSRSGSA